MTPLIGFAPDADPQQPGVLTECVNVIPHEYGVRSAPEPTDLAVSALPEAARSGFNATDLDGNSRLFVGTAAGLYMQSALTWTDVSRVGGYTLGGGALWTFAQYGDSTLAASPSAPIQRSDSGGSFADIAGAPSAMVIEEALGFAVAFNTTDFGDEWYCSALLDASDWLLNVNTQCVKGRLVGGPGQITAAKRFGDDLIAYKRSSMFVGRYQGAPSVWGWTQISNDTGAVGPLAVVNTPIGHLFMGKDNLYLFDGSLPKPLPTSHMLRRWLFADISQGYIDQTQILWDSGNHLVWIHYVSAGSTTLNKCVVLHLQSGRWGKADKAIEAAVLYTAGSITYDGGSPVISTYNDGPAIPYDSLYWSANQTIPALIGTDHKLKALIGSSASASFTTGDWGDESGYSFCGNLAVRYALAPTTATATGYVKDESGASVAATTSAAKDDGSHDMRQTARWHRFRVDTTGDFKATAARAMLKPSGRR